MDFFYIEITHQLADCSFKSSEVFRVSHRQLEEDIDADEVFADATQSVIVFLQKNQLQAQSFWLVANNEMETATHLQYFENLEHFQQWRKHKARWSELTHSGFYDKITCIGGRYAHISGYLADLTITPIFKVPFEKYHKLQECEPLIASHSFLPIAAIKVKESQQAMVITACDCDNETLQVSAKYHHLLIDKLSNQVEYAELMLAISNNK